MECSIQHTITIHTSDITAVCFNHDTLASSSSDKTVRLWNTDDYGETSSSPLCGHIYTAHCCVFSPCGNVLASCSTDGCCILWVVATGQKLATLQHESKVSLRTCCFSPDGRRLATGGDDEKMCLWDTGTYQLLKVLEGPEASIVALTFSPHSEFLIAGSALGDLRIWDGKYGHGRHLALEQEAHDLGVTCVAVSPSYGSAGTKPSTEVHQVNYLMVSGGFDNMLCLWDILSAPGSSKVEFAQRGKLEGHTGPVMGCCFTQAHRMVASVGADKTLRIWDPVKMSALTVVEGHSRYVTCCAFNHDGSIIATGSNDKLIQIWAINSPHLLEGSTSPKEIPTSQSKQSKHIRNWTIHDVSNWLKHIALPQYIPAFIDNAIDGVELQALTNEALQSALGVAALGHRNKILRSAKELVEKKETLLDEGIPDEYLCPITRELMTDPVMASDGYTYERSAISGWMDKGHTNSPMTNAPLNTTGLNPNRSLKMLISKYAQENKI